MKRVLFAGAIVLAAAGEALAADLPQAAPPPPRAPAAYMPAPQLYNWSGFYIGGNLGGSYVNQGATTTTSFAGVPQTSASTSASGFAGGGQLGINFQANQFVFGVEGDFDYLSNKATINLSNAVIADQHQYTLNMFSTVRGRFGMAFDRSLFYATAGLAMANYQETRTQVAGTVNGATPGTTESYSTWRFGFAVGPGFEYAFGDNWTARVEYLFADLASVNYSFALSQRNISAPNEYVNVV